MKRTLAMLCVVIFFCFPAVLLAQTDSAKQVKVVRINPYSSIKTSVFAEVSFGDYISYGNAVAFEVRKFTGLRHFFFLTGSVGQYRGQKTYRDSRPSSYDLSYKTGKIRLGTTAGKELYNAYVGASYIFDAQLSESFYSIPRGRQINASGDVTPYINRLAPFAGMCLKFRVLKVILIEVFYEYGLVNTFKPLKDNWRVPASESVFFSKKDPTLLKMYGASLHIKL